MAASVFLMRKRPGLLAVVLVGINFVSNNCDASFCDIIPEANYALQQYAGIIMLCNSMLA